MNKLVTTITISVLSLIFVPIVSYAEIIHQEVGKINNLIVDNNTIYFFKVDNSINSTTWIPDTRIYAYDDSGKRLVSDVLFIFPMELSQHGQYIYFTKLSDSCIGNIMCDYQDLVKMSKNDGSFKIIDQGLKSASRLSVEDKVTYVSESNGKIWMYRHDNLAPVLLYEGQNIIMDIASDKEGTIYWIEEINDQNSIILKMEKNSNPEVIARNLEIPYNLKNNHGIFWNEIYINSEKGSLSEYTKITEHKDSANQVLGNFENTIPIGKQSDPNHGPYLIVGNYLLLSNNTESNSKIQLQNTVTKESFEVLKNIEYTVEFMKASGDSLYLVGSDKNGFLIEKVALPVTVPEFSSMIVLSVAIGLTVIMFGYSQRIV